MVSMKLTVLIVLEQGMDKGHWKLTFLCSPCGRGGASGHPSMKRAP